MYTCFPNGLKSFRCSVTLIDRMALSIGAACMVLCGIPFFIKVEYSSASSHMAFGSFPRFARIIVMMIWLNRSATAFVSLW